MITCLIHLTSFKDSQSNAICWLLGLVQFKLNICVHLDKMHQLNTCIHMKPKLFYVLWKKRPSLSQVYSFACYQKIAIIFPMLPHMFKTQSAASYRRVERDQRRCAEKEGRNHSNPWGLALAEELRGVWLVLHSGGVQCLPERGYKKTKEAAGHVEWLLKVSEHPLQIPCYQRHTLIYNTHNIQRTHTESWNSRVISALLLT